MVSTPRSAEESFAATLADLATFGPHFALARCDPAAPPAPLWQPLAALVQQSALLRRRIERVRGALAATAGCPVERITPRVAASLAQLGLVGRLLPPALGIAVLDGRWPAFGLEQICWQDSLGGTIPLALAGDAAHAPAAATTATELLDAVIAPVSAAVAAIEPVPPRVLWGNVASVANSAAGQIISARPAMAPRVAAAATALLGDERLRHERAAIGPQFRRSSCCLLARVIGGAPIAVCGDCVLRRREAGERPGQPGGC